MLNLHVHRGSAGMSLGQSLKELAVAARRVIEGISGGRTAARDVAERIDDLKAQAPGPPTGEVQRWLERLGHQVRSAWEGRRSDRVAVPISEGRPVPRRGEASLFGLLWRWEWREEPIEGGTDIFSRITPPVACCPDCLQPLRVAPEQSRVVCRPVWPAIFTCPCGFFKGFRQTPGEIEAEVYREIDPEVRLALEVEQLGEEAGQEDVGTSRGAQRLPFYAAEALR